MSRQFRFAVGAVLALLGVLGIARPELFQAVPGTGGLVTLVGGCAVAVGLAGLFRARGQQRRTIDLAKLNDSPEATTDRTIDRALANQSERAREQLEAAVRRTLRYANGVDDEAADASVRAGSWTDDPFAAGLFSRTAATDGGPSAVRESFRTERDRLAMQIDRVLDELERLTGVASSDAETVLPGTETASHDAIEWLDPPGVGESVSCRTGRWAGLEAMTLVAVGVGVLTREPSLLLAGAVGVTLATGVRASAPRPPTLELDREVSATAPAPGEEVTVTVSVENTGQWPLFDVQVADCVPDGLTVLDGDPSVRGAIRSGEEEAITYTVRASPGQHGFAPAVACTRDVFGGAERAERVAAETTTITCIPTLEPLDAFPLRKQTTGHSGLIPTDIAGEGVEFYSTREYRPGDPVSRIDWKNYARRGELTTVEYREARSATVCLALDVRGLAAATPADAEASAFEASVTGTGRVFATLLGMGNRVGIAAVGSSLDWLSPGAGREHRERGRNFLAEIPPPSAAAERANVYPPLRALRERLSEDTQLVVFSPLLDESMADAVRQLDAYGHMVTVVAPDPTDASSPGRRLQRVERQLRLADLRGAGIRVADWAVDEPFEAAIDQMEAGTR